MNKYILQATIELLYFDNEAGRNLSVVIDQTKSWPQRVAIPVSDPKGAVLYFVHGSVYDGLCLVLFTAPL